MNIVMIKGLMKEGLMNGKCIDEYTTYNLIVWDGF